MLANVRCGFALVGKSFPLIRDLVSLVGQPVPLIAGSQPTFDPVLLGAAPFLVDELLLICRGRL